MILFSNPKNITTNTKFVAKNIKYYKTIDSTNNAARDADCKHGTLFIAEHQTNGKGRMGKSWVSQKGCGIWMSVVLMPEFEPLKINLITLIAGLAVCETLNELYNIPFKIKWPNDIVAHGKKVCGILTECKTENNKITKVVTGIGINVNTKAFPDELKNIATSLYMLTGKKSNRLKIISRFAEIFEKYYTFLNNDTESIIKKYTNLCATVGRDVVAVKNNKKIEGKATGITQTGELIIKKEDGTTLNVNSGEVSVRGMYGYI